MNSTSTKTDWLIALRSGEYRQGKWCLRNQWKDDYGDPKQLSSYEFCALGLLCHITKFRVKSWFDPFPRIKYTEESVPNPDYDILEFEGIRPRDQAEIRGMNDDGKSFVEIANWIEKYL